jgi:hypothetical protein
MLKAAVETAVHCTKLGRVSVWSEELQKYVCVRDAGFEKAIQNQNLKVEQEHPSINPVFKLVFVAAFGGTVFFVILCVGIHLWLGKEMPPLTVKLVDAMLDMAKIGFGAVVGLLGGQTLRGKR